MCHICQSSGNSPCHIMQKTVCPVIKNKVAFRFVYFYLLQIAYPIGNFRIAASERRKIVFSHNVFGSGLHFSQVQFQVRQKTTVISVERCSFLSQQIAIIAFISLIAGI